MPGKRHKNKFNFVNSDETNAKKFKVEEPNISTVLENIVEEPKLEVLSEELKVEESKVDEPKLEVPSEVPSEESKVEIKADEPKLEVPSEVPSEESKVDEPSEEIKVDEPKLEIPLEIPSEVPSEELKVEENKEKPQLKIIVDEDLDVEELTIVPPCKEPNKEVKLSLFARLKRFFFGY